MAAPHVDDEERRYLRDVQDHALRVQEQAAAFRELLQNILSVNLTLETKALSEASNAQNEEVKKISAWAAILFAPYARRHDLRHELRPHARAGLGARLSARARAHAGSSACALPRLQAPRLDLASAARPAPTNLHREAAPRYGRRWARSRFSPPLITDVPRWSSGRAPRNAAHAPLKRKSKPSGWRRSTLTVPL